MAFVRKTFRCSRSGGHVPEAAQAWLSERSAVAVWKPTTERNYKAMLAGVRDAPRHRGRAPKARLMARFGGMAVSEIRDVDVRSFLPTESVQGRLKRDG